MSTNGLRFGKDTEDLLSARRSASLRELHDHREDIRKNYPVIEALRNEIAETALDFSSKIMAAPDRTEELEKLAKEIVSAKEKELKNLLAAHGLPSDYLELKYRCPVCADTGIAGSELCSCIKQHMIERMFSGSGINPGESFKSFRHDLISDPRQNKAMERIYSYCLEYSDMFPDNDLPDLLLVGAPGIGKTFLLNCIGGRVLERGYSVLKVTASKLIGSVMDSITEDGVERPDYILPELLIIDDLGTEPMIRNVTIESILSIICERQDMNRATLIATNKKFEEIDEEYGERIISRIVSPRRVKTIKMTTPNVRVMK
ncbi:MAG: ATP-binding protein [Clostridia bacterium]|nr:ATP-binding protein [Clostridia bacterium]